MIYINESGIRIKANSAVRYSDFHKAWYIDGQRWIKTKQKFSGQCLVHISTTEWKLES